jgi:hypothetical protein
MSDEISVMRRAWLRVAKTSTMFRLQTGKAWLSAMGPKGVHRMRDGSIRIEAPRPIALGFGLANGDPVVGAHDLIGRTTIVITQAMVGKKLAVFTSLEAKNSEGGRRSKEQISWEKQTLDAGGIAGFFSSPEEAEQIVSDFIKKLETEQQ